MIKTAESKSLATKLAANVKAKGYSYDRALCKRFQTAAGIKADGLYGPATQTALSAHGVAAPKNLFVAAGMKKATLVKTDTAEEGGGNGLMIAGVLILAYFVFAK
jgi:murein L,D-transpeptidase YcbB/YkuD